MSRPVTSSEPRCFIYGLRDPKTQAIRYVGKTARGMVRPKQHQMRSYVFNPKDFHLHRTRWLRQLWADGLRCEIVILQVCEAEDDLNAAEMAWIAIGREAGTLTNGTDGGDGATGYRHTPESKAKQRAAQSSPEYKAKIRRANLGKIVSVETRSKLSERSRAFLANNPCPALGRKHSAETRAKQSAAAMGRKLTPERIAKMQAGLRSKPLRPSTIEKLRIAARKPKSAVGRENIRQGALKRWAASRQAKARAMEATCGQLRLPM